VGSSASEAGDLGIVEGKWGGEIGKIFLKIGNIWYRISTFSGLMIKIFCI
jgi:hypothetical protein